MEALRTEGGKHLPTAETDALFDRPVVHCTGRAGDLFLANYMTAHLIAPNVSPDIRFAEIAAGIVSRRGLLMTAGTFS